MCIFDGSCVELTEVNTEAQTSVFFLYHYYRRRPGTVGGADDVAGQYLLDLRHLLPPNSRVFVADKAGGAEARGSQSCAPAAEYSQGRPLLG